jgi:hypothetical protein
MGLPRTQSGYDFNWVIVDRLANVVDFIRIRMTYTRPRLAELYMSIIVCLHGVSKRIMPNRETQLILKF